MEAINTHGVPAGTVVVGVDGSASSHTALGWAVDQAVAEKRPLTLVCAAASLESRDGQTTMEEAQAEVARRADGLAVHQLLIVADPREALLQLSRQAALVVVGSRGRGPVRRLLLGSVGVAVTRHASCPVVVVRPGNPGLVRNGVLVGVDGSEMSLGVLEFAFRHASLHGLPLTVLHTFVDSMVYDATAGVAVPFMVDVRSSDAEEERLLLAESMSGMQEKYPDVPVRTELARGLPADRLLEEAARMNLVVVGSHVGGTAAQLLRGSVAMAVVEHATCPVALVPVGERA
ncbi:universal stress protein [Nocardioides sp.]|uniref:universal stress protein n=1 Tax=Nocardioides sp. TaxID=35761 RepID=UPI00286D8ACD|nr:universal stress protein [Nocardioides sp.]